MEQLSIVHFAEQWRWRSRRRRRKLTCRHWRCWWLTVMLVAVLGGVDVVANGGCCRFLFFSSALLLSIISAPSLSFSVLLFLFSSGGGVVSSDWEEWWQLLRFQTMVVTPFFSFVSLLVPLFFSSGFFIHSCSLSFLFPCFSSLFSPFKNLCSSPKIFSLSFFFSLFSFSRLVFFRFFPPLCSSLFFLNVKNALWFRLFFFSKCPFIFHFPPKNSPFFLQNPPPVLWFSPCIYRRQGRGPPYPVQTYGKVAWSGLCTATRGHSSSLFSSSCL